MSFPFDFACLLLNAAQAITQTGRVQIEGLIAYEADIFPRTLRTAHLNRHRIAALLIDQQAHPPAAYHLAA